MILRILGPATRAVAKIYRDLSERTRPADDRATARRHLPHDDVGNCVAGFAAQKPGREYGVGRLDEPRHDQRTAREQHDDYRDAAPFCAREHRFA